VAGAADPAELEVVPVRHPGRWVASAVVLLLLAMLVHSLFFSHVMRGGRRQPRYEWHVIDHFFFTSEVLHGLLLTVEITAVAMAGGVILGVALAIMRLSPNPIVSGSSWVYIWFFRGTPVLVQLLFWFYIGYNYPSLSFGIPFGPAFFHLNMNATITPFVAASFGLALNEGAYMSEIVRAGILSVDEGQTEAAQSIGMSRLMTLRLVVLPQAMRVIIPPTGNETISMLKTSSLVSVIAYAELLYSVQLIYSVNFKQIPLLLVASIWYLIFTSILSVGQYYIERHFGRGSSRNAAMTPLQRLRRNLFPAHQEESAGA
jgi:polar amino acid transport system permease protein